MRTFGIEIEAFGLPMSTVAAAVRDAGIDCFAENYNHNISRAWKVVGDGSIRGAMGFELVSPILSGDEGINQVRVVMNAIKAAGAQVNKSCGLHVHVGAAHFSLHEFKAIAKNYLIFEDFFDAIMPASRRANNNQYIASNRSRFGSPYAPVSDVLSGAAGHAAAALACKAINDCKSIDAVIRCVNPNNNRYHKLNLTAFWRHQTIEFRQHSGTVDAEKAVNWIKLLTNFVDAAAAARPRPRKAGAAPTASQVFAQFFRCFNLKAERAYFTARRRELHGDVA